MITKVYFSFSRTGSAALYYDSNVCLANVLHVSLISTRVGYSSVTDEGRGANRPLGKLNLKNGAPLSSYISVYSILFFISRLLFFGDFWSVFFWFRFYYRHSHPDSLLLLNLLLSVG